MPNDTPTGLVRVESVLRAERKVRLNPEDAIPHRPVEVVTAEEQRNEEQAKHRAEVPHDFFKRMAPVQPPLIPGASVSCESLLGFLAAMGAILPTDANYPILSSVKIYHEADASTLYLEAGSHGVWTLVALKTSGGANRGFTAMLPVQRAKNVLMALRDAYPMVVVGVDDHGICLGPHTVPFGGMIDDFPVQPVIGEWSARAVMPAFYYREICQRVLLARSTDFKNPALQGALLDFEHHDIDGLNRVLCTAVAMDGNRMHILRLPQMKIEVKATRLRALPPTCTVPSGFFLYMHEIIQHEWSAIEFGDDQLVAKGADFVVVAKAPPEAKSALRELAGWRKLNTDWPGYWLVSSAQLMQLVDGASLNKTAEEVRLQIDGIKGTLTLSAIGVAGDRYSQSIQARDFEGPPIVNVLLSIVYLRDALQACMGGLVRLAFARDQDEQAASPMVIRGEDEQFKAIIMPRSQE